MHGEPSISDDSILLAQWCEERDERAFAELVHKYERLVLSAVLRRSGDVEFARDVTQQVFAVLAAKARLLVGRSSIAGWLYQAAANIASRWLHSDFRRRERDQAAGSLQEASREEHWPVLEHALARLSGSEREAIVLHYLQDLSYPEVAAALHISEAAARKRVSRAVQCLGAILRKQGVQSPKAILAGAAALQATVAVPAGTAAAALATAAPVSAPLAFTLTFNAIMSHLSTKIAVCAAGLALIPLAYEWNANASLQNELSAREKKLPVHVASPSTPGANGGSDAQLQSTLAAIREQRKAAEARVAELTAFADKAEKELVVALGTVDSMARRLGSTVKRLVEVKKAMEESRPGSPDWKAKEAKAAEIVGSLPQMFGMFREIPKIERSAPKAARFYSALLAEAAQLDEPTRMRLEPALQAWVQRLHKEGLSFPQRPEREAEEWDRRRIESMRAMSAELQTLVPTEKAAGVSLIEALLPVESDDIDSTHFDFDLIFGKLP